MAKILVADDNSNIQKMVGLALKDHGIDVVAVGNGEAAVRKISDVRPDLVLADVFMPVRNGYEVCRYVKEDSALAHIPVILLVGAFDPLDEQEAQRVGADGVLKKPFVPPDPLISMVKSALVRANSAQPISAPKPAPVSAMMGTPAAVAPSVPAPAPNAAPAPAEADTFVDDIPPKPESLNIESSGKPLAFGSLLETPAAAEDDTSFVSAGAGPERDWGQSEEDEFEEEEGDESASWRRDGGSEELGAGPEPAAEKPARAKRKEAWTPTREKSQDLIEAAVEPELPPPPPPPTFVRPMSVQPPPPPQDTWAAPKKTEPAEHKIAAEVPPAPEPVTEPVVPSEPAFVAESPSQQTSLPPAAPPAPNGGDSWFSSASSPWDATSNTNQAAPTWELPSAPSAPPADAAPQEHPIETASVGERPVIDGSMPDDFVSEEASNEPVSYVSDPALVRNEVVASNPLPDLISDGSISPETVENIREQTTNALESVPEPVIETAKESTQKAPEQTAPEMDALVAKVLAKMSPEMLQAVTREILKPVVEAMIRDEIGAKKS